jgi:methionine-S-sulfoxide reductase
MVFSSVASANQDQEQPQQLCPLLSPPANPSMTFEAAMGWFWGPQRDFDDVEGIQETVVGYSGSHSSQTSFPTYRNIQDYAESIRLTFDPSQISYQDLLRMFFDLHTPTDPRWSGTQYRSAIFVHTLDQRKLAEAAVQARGTIGKYVAVEDASDFYRAEEYHQKYIEKATTGM